MQKIINLLRNLLTIVIVLSIPALGLITNCTNLLDGVPQEKENLAKRIILSKYPSFESEVKQLIKAQNPTYVGSYSYKFQKTDSENVLIVKYGVQGVDWLQVINPFNNKSTTDIFISVRVALDSKLVVPVDCVSNDSWWSSQKTICK